MDGSPIEGQRKWRECKLLTNTYLPGYATAQETCEWLEAHTSESWQLPRLIEYGLTPWFRLEYTPEWHDFFGGREEGYMTPMRFAGDTLRLIDDRSEALVTLIETYDGKLAKISHPGVRVPIAELRFKSDDVKRLAKDLSRQCNIPGKMPKVAIGQLAVKAAWQIEAETGRGTDAKQVMERLQSWATEGKEPHILMSAEIDKRAVIWKTSKEEPKKYSIEACARTLSDWNKSRA